MCNYIYQGLTEVIGNTMLPSALFTTFRQYKQDTQTITEWLASTARLCGYQPPTVSEKLDTVASKAKSKNKKKKKAATPSTGETNTQSQPAAAPTSSKEYVVKTNEYVPMAQAITRSDASKVVIPLSVIKTWKSCIAGRSTTSKWYETNTERTDDQDSNITHEHFIEILKRALQILVPVARLQELDRKQFKLEKNKTVSVQPFVTSDNKFAQLEIQDIDESAYEALADAATSSEDRPKATDKKPKYIPEGPNPFDEWYFALQCFMEDLEILQQQAQTYWEDYADGEIDLVTTAISTNTAIEMVKRAEEEFLKLKRPDEIEAWGKIDLPRAWFIHCLARDDIDERSAVESGQFFVPMGAWEQAKESYLLLQRLCIVYSNGTVPGRRGNDRAFAITRPAHFGAYNPELDFEDISDERQYQQMAACLSDMLVTIGALVMMVDQPFEDMLMQGIRVLQDNEDPPPMWLLFACQNFLDIHFTLGTRSERPYEELRDFGVATRRNLKQHQAFMRENYMPRMRAQDDEDAVDEVLEELETWILNDEFKKIMSSFKQTGSTKKRRIWQDFEILRLSPLLCGVMKYTFHIQLQWKGITLVNDTGLVAAAHLYNALQMNGYLGKEEPKIWEDMEYLLDLHKAEDTFMGERPRSLEDCTKRLALISGVAPTTFARRRRGNTHRVLRSRNGSKFLKPSTPVTQILGTRYLQPNVPFDWHLDQLETVIGFSFEEQIKNMHKVDEVLREKIKHIDLSTEEGKQQLLRIVELPDVINESWCKRMDVSVTRIRAGVVMDEFRKSIFNYEWKDKAFETLIEIRKGERKREEALQSDANALKKKTMPIDDDEESSNSSVDSEDYPARKLPLGEEWNTMHERWQQNKTLPLDVFINILHDSLQKEYLDIHFDYFAFFRSAFSLMREIQEEVKSLIEPWIEEERVAKKTLQEPEGAVCVVPQLTMLLGCDPLKAPGILVLKNRLEVDKRPLRIAAKVMKSWIQENGDSYCISERDREDQRTENVLKEGPKVRYFDSDDETEGVPSARNPEDRKIGWSSALGMVDGLNAREMREVLDAMKDDVPFGSTVAETLARLKGVELTDEDKALAETNRATRDALAQKIEMLLDSDEDSAD